ncbi:PREDICTED: uncharacterized protein LOC103338321 [Prunus mume]|uniref:Uncharacterized protein LOC103338321 n=1 Tax=Prunus mume TaxID=102107 RepID=A0ABM0PHL1_PRUMU|nr:PREDICTED: uncharacterized protein LOC103338321 [Prunus mume]
MFPLQTSISSLTIFIKRTRTPFYRETQVLNWGFSSASSLSLPLVVCTAMEEVDLESIGHGRTSSRCCFCIPASSAWWERMRANQNNDRWWSRGLKAFYKLREWSEIVAGPRWKTFIRRFNRNRSGGGGSSGAGRHHGKFQYDPLSYALNFDEGKEDEDDEGGGFRDFSTRFASLPPVRSGLPESSKDVAVYG